MNKVNWGRFALGGLLAAVICFVTDGFMHEVLLKQDWQAMYEGLRATAPTEHNNSSFAYFGLMELGRGYVALFAYLLMRAPFGAGPKTAVFAGLFSWVAFSLAGPVQFIPLGIVTCGLWAKAAGFQLVTSVLSTLAGAAIYKPRK